MIRVILDGITHGTLVFHGAVYGNYESTIHGGDVIIYFLTHLRWDIRISSVELLYKVPDGIVDNKGEPVRGNHGGILRYGHDFDGGRC